MTTLSDMTANALNTQEGQRVNNCILHVVNCPNSGDAILSLSAAAFPLPKQSNGILTMQFLNEKRYYAGMPDFDGMLIQYRDLVTSSTHATITAWRTLVYDPGSGKIGFAYGSAGYKRNGYILMYSSDGSLARQWNLFGIWPSMFDPGNADNDGDGFIRIGLNLVVEKVRLGTAGTPPADYQV